MTAMSVEEDVFPRLISCGVVDAMKEAEQTLFDVRFYPFPTVDNEQIFAAVGEREVFVWRVKPGGDPPFELLRWFHDEDPSTSINILEWTRDSLTGAPLLCFAGSSPKQIRIMDVLTGESIRELPGHGKAINDLAVSPLSTDLLASASEDHTIRLWNLHPRYRDSPCVAKFCGEGHRQHILTINFHHNGRWLLSGGMDAAVCMWSVPSPQELESGGPGEPQIVYYPYFHSTEVHHNYVDCVRFHGDLIFSRAARDQTARDRKNEILLWKIDGFDPDAETPADPPMPSPGVCSRSSFPHEEGTSGFHRLLTFFTPDTDRFYHRFGLLQSPYWRPILCMGTQRSRFMFWDLQALQEGKPPPTASKKGKVGRPRGRKAGVNADNLSRLDSMQAGSVGSESTGGGHSTPIPSSIAGNNDRKSDLADAFHPLPAHAVQIPQTNLTKIGGRTHDFATSHLAWSPDGRWLVGVGDRGIVCVFFRERAI